MMIGADNLSTLMPNTFLPILNAFALLQPPSCPSTWGMGSVCKFLTKFPLWPLNKAKPLASPSPPHPKSAPDPRPRNTRHPSQE